MYQLDTSILYNPIVWIVLALELIFKCVALWKCGRNNQMGWYLAIFFINTAGLLPIIYLIGFQKKPKSY